MSGQLDALLQHLVPTADYYPDRTYIFAFLLSSRLYIKPHALLAQVVRLCMLQQNLADQKLTKVSGAFSWVVASTGGLIAFFARMTQEKLGRFCPHMVQLLSEWMETFPYDFRDERVMQHVRQLTQRCVALDPSLRRDVSQMLHNLLHRLTALEKYEEFLEKINTEASAALIDTVNVVRIPKRHDNKPCT